MAHSSPLGNRSEVVPHERYRRSPRVEADGPDPHELLLAGEPRLLDELDAHDRVLVEEPPGVLAICTDPAHNRSDVDDDVRVAIRERTIDPVLRPQVVVA